MRIGRKLAATHATMSLLLVGLVFGSKLVIDRIDRDFDAISEETLLIIDDLNNMRTAGLRIISATNEYAFALTTSAADGGGDENDNNGELKELERGVKDFDLSFARYFLTVSKHAPTDARNRDDIGDDGATLIDESLRFIELLQTGAPRNELVDARERQEDAEGLFHETISLALKNEQEEFKAQKNELLRITSFASNMAWVGSVVLALLLLIAGRIASRTITRPLKALIVAAEQLKQGNFSARVEVNSNDEASTLSRTFNQMSEALEEHINSRTESEMDLKREISNRLQAEVALQELNNNLEKLVAERTATISENETALLEERDRAETASQAKSNFLANMSHELRTPLNAIIGYSEMMLEDAQDEGAQERMSDLQKVQRSGKHLLGLINDILDISKIEAGKIDMNIGPVDLTNLIDDVENTALPLMEVNGNRLKIIAPENLGSIECDEQRLRQVLLNLLSNAAKFTEKGAIGLIVENDGDGWMRIAVRDNGIGMSEEQISRIFEPFGQADNTITKRYGGTGLGLAISHRFIDMMGGRITIDSELGAGSCFTVSLPDFADTSRSIAGTNNELPILIIEDTLSDSSLLERYLLPTGYPIELARDGEQGLIQARATPPQAIILDLELPGMDGLEVLEKLRSDDDLRSIPVIVTSVHDESDRAIELGAQGYITKPFDRQLLLTALEQNVPGWRSNGTDSEPEILAQAAN